MKAEEKRQKSVWIGHVLVWGWFFPSSEGKAFRSSSAFWTHYSAAQPQPQEWAGETSGNPDYRGRRAGEHEAFPVGQALPTGPLL